MDHIVNTTMETTSQMEPTGINGEETFNGTLFQNPNYCSCYPGFHVMIGAMIVICIVLFATGAFSLQQKVAASIRRMKQKRKKRCEPEAFALRPMGRSKKNFFNDDEPWEISEDDFV